MSGLFQQSADALDRVAKYPLFSNGQAELTLQGLLLLLALCVIVVLSEYLLRRHFIMRLLRRTPFNSTLQFAIGRIAGYGFILVGWYIAFQLVGINLSSLAMLAGAVTVGLGFALQNIVSNFVSGLIILAERPIAIGDRIEVGGVAGQVEKISLRSTTVQTNDNITIIVPNADFIVQRVINWSHHDPRVRIHVPVGVAYGTDAELVRRVLTEVARGHPKALPEPAPIVYLTSFGDSAIHFELLVWTAEMTFNPDGFRSDLNFAIEKAFREHGISIPFPQRDLHIRTVSLPAAPAPSR